MLDLQFEIDPITNFLVGLLNTPSPTGYHAEAIGYVETRFAALGIRGLALRRTPKGALVITWPGDQETAPRGLTTADDRAQIDWLRRSEKNRAENVMIVDMIRNDFGRVARAGSVDVPTLFTVERWPVRVETQGISRGKTWPGNGERPQDIAVVEPDQDVAAALPGQPADRRPHP